MQTHPNLCKPERSLELHGGILSSLSNLDLGRLDSLQKLSIRWDEVDDIVIGTTEGRVSTSGVSTRHSLLAYGHSLLAYGHIDEMTAPQYPTCSC